MKTILDNETANNTSIEDTPTEEQHAPSIKFIQKVQRLIQQNNKSRRLLEQVAAYDMGSFTETPAGLMLFVDNLDNAMLTANTHKVKKAHNQLKRYFFSIMNKNRNKKLRESKVTTNH